MCWGVPKIVLSSGWGWGAQSAAEEFIACASARETLSKTRLKTILSSLASEPDFDSQLHSHRLFPVGAVTLWPTAPAAHPAPAPDPSPCHFPVSACESSAGEPVPPAHRRRSSAGQRETVFNPSFGPRGKPLLQMNVSAPSLPQPCKSTGDTGAHTAPAAQITEMFKKRHSTAGFRGTWHQRSSPRCCLLHSRFATINKCQRLTFNVSIVYL